MLVLRMDENWRVGELESWRVGELESWRVGELELYVGIVSSGTLSVINEKFSSVSSQQRLGEIKIGAISCSNPRLYVKSSISVA